MEAVQPALSSSTHERTSLQVFGLRNRFKMVGVTAGSVSTEMIQLQAFGYRPDEMFVDDPMQQSVAGTAVTRYPGAGPNPATRYRVFIATNQMAGDKDFPGDGPAHMPIVAYSSPARLDRCVRKVSRKHGARNAWAICQAALAGSRRRRRK